MTNRPVRPNQFRDMDDMLRRIERLERASYTPPAFSAETGSSTGPGVNPVVVTGGEIFDNGDNYNAGTGLWTCPVAAKYRIWGWVQYVNAVAGNAAAVDYQLNGAGGWIRLATVAMDVTTGTYDLMGERQVVLAAGNTIAFRYLQTEAGVSRAVNVRVGVQQISL